MRFVMSVVLTILCIPLVHADQAKTKLENEALHIDHQTFRTEIVNYVRSVALDNEDNSTKTALVDIENAWRNHYQQTHWQIHISSYHNGEQIGAVSAEGPSLTDVLQQATKSSLGDTLVTSKTDLDDYFFKISFGKCTQ